jgi:hypothetical protein
MNNRLLTILAIVGILAVSVSCKNKKPVAKTTIATTTTEVAVSSSDSFDQLLSTTGDTLMLSAQKLTGWEQHPDAFNNHRQDYDFLHENTPAHDAFFAREPGIKEDELEKTVCLRHNYCAVMNRVLHSYEWFKRQATDMGNDVESAGTKQDSIRAIRESQPRIPDAMLVDRLQNAEALNAARQLVRAYKRFDGNDGEGSPFYQAFRNLSEVFDKLPEIAPKEMLDSFENDFWTWYDKEQFVPGINGIVRMHMQGYEGEMLSDEKLAQLGQAVKREKDIDRRTILALEYVKFNRPEGTVLLGDIIESGIYTRYLLEAWISWRANVQMEYSPSSFSVIANNYYDKLRVKCLNTMIRHCQSVEDDKAKCLMENLILCELVHRMGSIAGNSSFLTCMHLSYDEFIHPNLLLKDK